METIMSAIKIIKDTEIYFSNFSMARKNKKKNKGTEDVHHIIFLHRHSFG